jgi:hypothetical protein
MLDADGFLISLRSMKLPFCHFWSMELFWTWLIVPVGAVDFVYPIAKLDFLKLSRFASSSSALAKI